VLSDVNLDAAKQNAAMIDEAGGTPHAYQLDVPDEIDRAGDVGSSPGVSRAAVRARTRSLARRSKRRHPIVSAQQEMIDSSDENGVWM
jgi:hypothetical protein